MSVTAADSSSSFLALEDELQLPSPSLPSPSDSFAKSSQQHVRRQSKALSISSLSDESSNGERQQRSVSAKTAVATEACRDVERELAAIETRLSVFRGRRRRIGNKEKEQEQLAVSSTSSVSSNAVDASSPIFSKLSKAQQEAGAVADQVATTLLKCDQLLQRVKSCGNKTFILLKAMELRVYTNGLCVAIRCISCIFSQ